VKQKSNGSWTRVGLTIVFLCIFAGMAYGFTCHGQSPESQIDNYDFTQAVFRFPLIDRLTHKFMRSYSHAGSKEQGDWAAMAARLLDHLDKSNRTDYSPSGPPTDTASSGYPAPLIGDF
jgi:hypothetical protein